MSNSILISLLLMTSVIFAGEKDKETQSIAEFKAGLVTFGELAGINNIDSIDVDNSNYRYPGKALLMSLVAPGIGQFYTKEYGKMAVFIGVELVAFNLRKGYNQRGIDTTKLFEDFANEYWDYYRWITTSGLYSSTDWSRVGTFGMEGSHKIEFSVDTNGDGILDYLGNTQDNGDELLQFMSGTLASDTIIIRKNSEYYENIGKYNQFFSGWNDADPDKPDIRVSSTGTAIAFSENRDRYLTIRENANKLLSAAGYAVSAVMFNHVLSALDALYSTSEWNKENASKVTGALLYHPNAAMGIQGINLTIHW